MLKQLLARAMTTHCNQLLQLDPELETLLKPLQGRNLAAVLTDFGLSLCFIPEKNKLRVTTDITSAGVTLTGASRNLIKLGLSQTPQAILATKAITLEGDNSILQAYQDFMQQLDLDWENTLAKYFGDTAAHEIARPVRKAAKWKKDSFESGLQDITETLQEEKQLLPCREEVEDFFEEIDELKQAVERCEAKIMQQSRPRNA